MRLQVFRGLLRGIIHTTASTIYQTNFSGPTGSQVGIYTSERYEEMLLHHTSRIMLGRCFISEGKGHGVVP
jgi:hypothetical protein